MTARVTTLKGAEAGVYYVEALPSYYLDAGEPPGVWRGRGAGLLGLSGEVDDDAFLAVMAGLDPETGKLLGRRYGESSVRGFDVTASAPKSVSVLFALGDDRVRHQVLAAHDAAVGAMVDWVEAHAHTRFRIDGQVAIVDADGIVAACFRQHTSRALDPQLHTHVVIANRVRSPDGRWLALDARTIKLDQRTLSAVYHAGLRAELAHRLGVAWREPHHGIAELAAVPDDVLAAFSSRTEAVRDRFEEKLERFCERFGRQPTPRERWRLEREAVIDSRPAKTHGHDAHDLHTEWAAHARGIGRDPEQVVDAALAARVEHRRLDTLTRRRLTARALGQLAEQQSTWRPAELVRELAAAVPTDVLIPADRLIPWLDEYAEQVTAERLVELSAPIPDGAPVRRDGRPVTESVAERALTTPHILAEEEELVAWAERRVAGGGADAAIPAGDRIALTGPQRELAAAVAGTRPLVVAVGPAGTGKTTALRPAIGQLHRDGRPVFGVAPSAAAAEVLATDGGVDADTLDKLLAEHRLERLPAPRFDLPAGATVLVDEAAMVATPKLAELARLADRRRWRIILVGDPLQFSAVGRAGMFALLADHLGAIELDRVQRFTNDWERQASLRLRRGDPGVLEVYERHGRLHGGTRRQMQTAVVAAWWHAQQRGETAVMLAPTNDTVAVLNRVAQHLHAGAGHLDLDDPSLDLGAYALHVGDLIATRQNDRSLRTDRGFMVKNRDRWHVLAVGRDGSLTVAGRTGSARLPAGYVQEHVELAYAQTSHAAQGRTVDRAFLLLDTPTDSRGVYVPLTRGRHTNEAFVVCDGEQSPVDVLGAALVRDWIDQPALARRAALQSPDRVLPDRTRPTRAPLGPKVLRQLLERDHTLTERLARLDFDVDHARRQLANAEQRRPRILTSLAEAQWRVDNAQQRIADLDRPLRRHRHRDDIDAWRRTIEASRADIERHHAELADLDATVPTLRQQLAEAHAVGVCERPALEREHRGIRARLDLDRHVRAERLAAETPRWLLDHLGSRPRGPKAAMWDDAAARLDQHRTAFDVADIYAGPLGRRPRWDDGAYQTSHRAAASACQRLEVALGRDVGVDAPGLGGRSL